RPAYVMDLPLVPPAPQPGGGDERGPGLVRATLEPLQPSIVDERVVVDEAHVRSRDVTHREVARLVAGDHGVPVHEREVTCAREAFETTAEVRGGVAVDDHDASGWRSVREQGLEHRRHDAVRLAGHDGDRGPRL